MFCPNCGKEIQGDAAFCPNCGNAIAVAQQPTSPVIQQQSQNPKNSKNKKTVTVVISFAVMLVVFLLGKFVVAPAMLSDSPASNPTNSTNSTYQPSQSTNGYTSSDSTISGTSSLESNDTYSSSESTLSAANSEYQEIFLSRNIVESPAFFFGLNSAEFAGVTEDGSVHKMAYGYNGDAIEEIIETYYYPIEGYSEDEKNTLEANVRAAMSEIEAYDNCTVTYNMGYNYYSATVTVKGLTEEKNIENMYNLGVISEKGTPSLSESEAQLLASGYIKK